MVVIELRISPNPFPRADWGLGTKFDDEPPLLDLMLIG